MLPVTFSFFSGVLCVLVSFCWYLRLAVAIVVT